MSKWKSYILMTGFLLGFVLPAPSGAAPTAAFQDIEGSYAKEQITKLQSSGVIVGDTDGKFHPKRAVTRGEFVTMLGRTLSFSPLESEIPSFRDVPKSSWYYGWVQAGTALKLVNGTSNSTFSPDTYINRQEVAALLVRAFTNNTDTSSKATYQDVSASSPWAVPYIAKAMELELMKGYQGQFRPTANLTREEAAVVLERISTKYKSTSSNQQPIQLGWQYLSSTQQFIDRVSNSTVNTLSPRWFFLESSGELSDVVDPSLVNWAHRNGKKVWPLVGNRFDPDVTHQVLSQPDKRKQHVNQIAELARKYQLDGINIDYEAMYPKDRDLFSQFIKELAAALKPYKIVLSVDVPPDSYSEWSEPFDYQALGKHADYVVLMAYEQYWSGSPQAGSIATLPWMTQKTKELAKDVPMNKIIVGMPLYTRDWYHENGKVTSTDLSIPSSFQIINAASATITWNEELGQYEATYQRNGVSHKIWLEESRSLSLKYQTSLNLGVAGSAYWYMDQVGKEIWDGFRNAKKYHDVVSSPKNK